MDSAPSIDYLKIQYTPASRNGKQLGEEMVVGLDQDVKLIRDQLVQDLKQLDVVSIVGMGGLGKTTLANKVYNDPYVMYHFQVHAWVTGFHTYEKSDLLIQILASIGTELDTVETSYYQLREKLHKSLVNMRYFIVIDDIWSNEAWDDLMVFFPNYDIKSQILVTSRLKEVALHAKSNGFVHHMGCLTDEDCWELLCKKMFNDNACREWLIKPGTEIAKKCHGLPLAVVVIGGVLTKEDKIKVSWGRITQSVSAYIVNDPNGYIFTKKSCYRSSPRVRSILSFHSGKSMLNMTFGDFYFYPILMVLDLQKCRLEHFPRSIELLVQLRYLAFWYTGQLPSSICKL